MLFPESFPRRSVTDDFLFGLLDAAERAFGQRADRQGSGVVCVHTIEQTNEKQANEQRLNDVHGGSHGFPTAHWDMNRPLTRSRDCGTTLSPSEGERDGVRGRFMEFISSRNTLSNYHRMV